MDTRTLCLGVLCRGPATGYEIKKAFEEGPLAHIHTTSFGSIYPALAQLLADGQVAVEPRAQGSKPDKKIYSMTESGRAALQRALSRPPMPDNLRSDFLFSLFFAENLRPAHVALMIDQRIAWYRESLERMADCEADPDPQCADGETGQSRIGAAFVRGLGQAVYGAAAAYLEQNRDALLADLPAVAVKEAAE